ncbi:MAG: hypothetical protein HOP27_09970 [Anaerolineales bacterium]|nr:hypothetical protein [Anaerolineales bacterium]
MVAKNKEKNAHPTFSEYQKQFLLEYFKEMRTEINLRIKNHSSLVWAKVVTTGALMSFLLAQNIDPKIRIGGLILVPVIAILYDIMIAQNLKTMHKIGHFIRDQLENVLFPDFELWENYAGQKNIEERNYGLVDIFLLLTFTFGTMLITFYILWLQANSLLILLFAGGALVAIAWLIGFMRRHILFFKKSKNLVSAKESQVPKHA